MKREIKFRGKDKQGRWWKGDLRHTMMELGKPHCRIVNVDKDDYDRLQEIWSDPIQEETIGQFTGFLDFHRKEIYEGDIIQRYYDIGDGNVYKSEGMVVFEGGAFGVKHDDTILYLHNVKGWTVIGNIHDNPELLKGGAQ